MTKSPVHIAVSRAVDHVAGFYHPLEIKRILEESILSEREHWLLWTPVFLALGIGGYFLLPIEPPGLVVILGLCVAFAAVVLSQPGIRLAFIALMIFMSGLGLAQWRNDRVAAPQIIDGSHSFSVEGTVEAVEPQDNGHVRILLDALKIKTLALEDTPQRVRITVRTDSHDVTAGDRVSLRAILSPPPDPVAPYAFDFARDSWFKRIGGVGFAVTDLAILERPTTRSLTNRVNGLRQYIAHRTTMRLDNRAGGIAAALLTGLRGYMAEDDVEAMRIAGLAHLLAISGLHLGLVASTAFFLIRLGAAAIPAIALRFDTRKAAAIMAWLVAFAYFWLAGATIPTQRAFLMISIVLLALLIGRQPISLRVVALSALLILIATPEALLSVSFQMSFAAVTALVAAYEVLAPKLAPWRRRAGFGKRTALYFLGVVLTTLIAEAAIAPFSAYHFNQLTSYGLIANLVAVPLMAFVVMPLGLLALLLMPFGGDGPVLDLMGFAISGILSTAHQVSGFPGAEIVVRSVPAFVPVLFTLGVLCLALWKTRPLRLMAVPFFCVAVAILAASKPPDLLISRDADLFAARTSDGLAVSTMSKARYSREQWTAMIGASSVYLWSTSTTNKPPPVRCDRFGCSLGETPHRISFAFTPEALREDCQTATLLIAAIPVRQNCPAPSKIIDRFDVWRDGAYALWIDGDEIKSRSVRQVRGQRPWVRSR